MADGYILQHDTYLISNSTYSVLSALVSPGAAASYLIRDEESHVALNFSCALILPGIIKKKKNQLEHLGYQKKKRDVSDS